MLWLSSIENSLVTPNYVDILTDDNAILGVGELRYEKLEGRWGTG
jgi:hypothetical protein